MRPQTGLVRRIFPSHAVSLILAIALVGPGCAYIGQVTFETKRDSLDHDGDGAPFGGPDKDCDDFEAKVAPNLPEIPYDGLDNDCNGADIVDADGDGYPGVLKEAYLADHPGVEWPASVVDGPLDCADDVTVFPNAAQIFPGNTNDQEYDGIDSDCAGDNDFDFDGDGYMPDVANVGGSTIDVADAFATYVATWGYEGLNAAAQFGDCNDFRADANPGVSPGDDAWYDGHDSDCAGNNDFDADGDGYMPNTNPDTGTDLDVLYGDFVDLYHPDGAPWVEQWDDCLDQADPARVGAIPADVWPGNPTDIAYDGVDSDCACDNDFDGDGDGTMPDSAALGSPNFDDYDAAWGCGLTPIYGDCDDDDDLTFPGSLERLGDGADSDCDLDPDSTPFSFQTVLWDRPRSPAIARTDDHYVIMTSAENAEFGGVPRPFIGLGLPISDTDGYLAPVGANVLMWQGAAAPLPLGQAVDAVGVGQVLWSSTTYRFVGSSGYVMAKRSDYDSLSNQFTPGGTEWDLVDEDYLGTATDLVVDNNGHPWSVACGTNSVQVMRGDDNSGTTALGASIAPSPLQPLGVPAGVCFWHDDPTPTEPFPGVYEGVGSVVVCDPGISCTQYDFDAGSESLVPSAVNNWAGRQLDYGQYRDGWHILLETGLSGVTLETPFGNVPMLPGWNVTDTDAHWRDLAPPGTGGPDWEIYTAAVAEPVIDDGLGPRVVLSWGPITGPFTEKVLAYEHPNLPSVFPKGVGIYADDQRLFLAVSGESDDQADCRPYPPAYPYTYDYCLDDAVGWLLFGWAP